ANDVARAGKRQILATTAGRHVVHLSNERQVRNGAVRRRRRRDEQGFELAIEGLAQTLSAAVCAAIGVALARVVWSRIVALAHGRDGAANLCWQERQQRQRRALHCAPPGL